MNEKTFFEKLGLNTFAIERRKDRRIKKCNSCSQIFNNENIVIAMKKNVPIRGTRSIENKTKESLVHLHFRKDCLKKAKFNFNLLKICSCSIFSKKKISALEIGSGMNFPKHIKVKLTKKNT